MSYKRGFFAIGSLALALAASTLRTDASVISVGTGAFPGGSPLLTFAGLADGTEVNGLFVGGVGFNYSLGNGQVIIDGGPGVTNNVAPPNIVSVGNPTGVLTVILPGFFTLFGDGYALANADALANATTITLFSDAVNVGSLSYNSVPDPTFTGGFAGIQSTIPFNRVAITFNSIAPAWAIDNVRFAGSNIPEPSTALLLISGLGGLIWVQRRRFVKR